MTRRSCRDLINQPIEHRGWDDGRAVSRKRACSPGPIWAGSNGEARWPLDVCQAGGSRHISAVIGQRSSNSGGREEGAVDAACTGSVRDRASGAPSARGVPLGQAFPSRAAARTGTFVSPPSPTPPGRHRGGVGRTRASRLTAVAARTELRRRERRGRRKRRSHFGAGGGRTERPSALPVPSRQSGGLTRTSCFTEWSPFCFQLRGLSKRDPRASPFPSVERWWAGGHFFGAG